MQVMHLMHQCEQTQLHSDQNSYCSFYRNKINLFVLFGCFPVNLKKKKVNQQGIQKCEVKTINTTPFLIPMFPSHPLSNTYYSFRERNPTIEVQFLCSFQLMVIAVL